MPCIWNLKGLAPLLAGICLLVQVAHADILVVGKDGRFVRVDIVGDGTLAHSDEVQAFGGGTNFALNQTPVDDSLSTNLNGGHGAANNLVNGVFDGGGNTWTRDSTAVATIDLGATQSLDRIVVHQRAGGCCQGRLTNVTATLHADAGGTPGAVVATQNFPGQVDSAINFDLSDRLIRPGGAGAIGTEVVEGTTGHYVQLINNGGVARPLHTSEIEVFAPGVSPDNNAGPSTNDIQGTGTFSASTTAGGGHGSASAVFDGDLETAGDTWTAGAQVGAQYTLDVGQSTEIGLIRVWQRNGCCGERLDDFTINTFSNADPGPGATVDSQSFPNQAALFEQFTLGDSFRIESGDTLQIEIDLNAMTADLLSVGADGLGDLTIDPGATLDLIVSGSKVPQTFDILDFGTVTGSFDNINISGANPDLVILDDLLINGQITIAPEPASIGIWALLGLALCGYGIRFARRRK